MSNPQPEQDDPATPSGPRNPYAAPLPPQPPPPPPAASPPAAPFTAQYLPPSPRAGYAAGPGRTNALSIASLSTGLASLLLTCCWFLSGPVAVAAVVLGVVGLQQIGQRGQDGRALAIAGIATGGAALAFMLFRLTVFGFSPFGDAGFLIG